MNSTPPSASGVQNRSSGLASGVSANLLDPAIDLLGEIVGGGGYEDLRPHVVTLTVFGVACQCLGLERLIRVKRAAGRPKDLEAVAELEAILEERGRAEP